MQIIQRFLKTVSLKSLGLLRLAALAKSPLAFMFALLLLSACEGSVDSYLPPVASEQNQAQNTSSQPLKPPSYRMLTDCSDELITVISLNAYLLFDHRNDGARYEKTYSKRDYATKLVNIIKFIDNLPCQPNIIAFQEVESKRILKELAEQLNGYLGSDYRAILIEGNDQQGIDNGFLVASPFELVSTFQVDGRSKRATGGFIHDRPPLWLRLRHHDNERIFNVINVHMRSMRGLHDHDGGRIQMKRLAQIESLVDTLEDMNAQEPLIVLGDWNSYADGDTLESEPIELLIEDTPLQLLTDFLPEKEQFSYTHQRRGVMIDHAFANAAARELVQSYGLVRGVSCATDKRYCDPTEAVSDHEPLFVQLRF
ncbi:MAG: endonuclease/exonuclease/phosphatase family protein [Pseudomonadota bacterium]|nr:endonuclease/exonuclease/phosphatase family protein [Pseudomonadota bacterium]